MSNIDLKMADELMANVKNKSDRALYLQGGVIYDNTIEILKSFMDLTSAQMTRIEEQDEQYARVMSEVRQLKGMVGDLIQHQKAVEKYLERINSQLSVDPEPEVIQADSFLKEAALETISAHEIFAKDTADGFERLEAMMIWKYIRDCIERQ